MGVELESRKGLLSAVDQLLRRIAEKQLALGQMESEMQARIETVRRTYGPRIALLEAEIGRLGEQLDATCTESRSVLLPDNAKTLVRPFGRVGFRRSGPAVCLQEGMTAAQVCQRLAAAGLEEFIRRTESPDREAIKSAWQEGRLSRSELRRCGLQMREAQDQCYFRTTPAAS